MAINYDNLWKLLIDKKRTDLVYGADIRISVLTKMGKNKYVSPESVDKIYRYLNCDVKDVSILIVDNTEK